MGKLIVNEQDVKRIVDESTTNKTGIINQFVNKEIQAEVNKLHLDLSNYNLKHKEENNEINKAIKNLLERISILEEQKKDEITVNNLNNSELKPPEVNDILDIRSLCRELNIPGFAPTNLKYYLYEHGIFDMKINEFRNSYFIKSTFYESVDKELLNYIHISKKKSHLVKTSLHILRVIKIRSGSLLSDMKKRKEYKIARKNVSVKRVEDYKEEVKRICGMNSSAKWTPMYKEFSKTFPNFYKDWEKADKKFKENNLEHPDWNYPKVDFIVNDMQQGNVLLKIACQLYVD